MSCHDGTPGISATTDRLPGLPNHGVMAAVDREGRARRARHAAAAFLTGISFLGTLVAVTLFVGTLVGGPGRAHAQSDAPADPYDQIYEPTGTAQELLEEGKAEMRAGRYARAQKALAAAAKKERTFSILGNLGQTEAVLAENESDETKARRWWVQAAGHLSESIQLFPPAGPVEQRAALERKLAQARAFVVTVGLKITPAQACATLADGTPSEEREVGCGPFSYPVYALPGDVTVRVRAEGHAPKEVRISDAKAGSQETVAAALERLTATPPPAPEAPVEADGADAPLLPIAAATGGLAVVAAVVGGALWAVGGQHRDDAATIVASGREATGDPNFCHEPSPQLAPRCAEVADHLAAHDRLRNAGVGLFVGGGVLAVAAGAMFVAHAVGGEEGEDVGHLTVTPVVGPREAGVIFGGRF